MEREKKFVREPRQRTKQSLVNQHLLHDGSQLVVLVVASTNVYCWPYEGVLG
jgi:hypothetical protein